MSQEAGVENLYEPIAITGIGCRLPGNVYSPSQLWELLRDGRSGQGEVPSWRFNANSHYHPQVDNTGTIHGTGGYFINEDVRLFENSFFGINNLEASYMDPQQKKLLEVVFETFENAGVTLEALSGSNTGTYVANFTNDFQIMNTRDPELFHRYSATGMGITLLANRVSHVFNLQGPSCVLDTACSSSLYALHTACSALQKRECDSAIVAAANLILSPEVHIATTKAGVLSATSTCHTFDEAADGYGRAEGVSAIYIKRLSDALKDGDHIRSVIRGTAINSNGRTPGITQPSVAGQMAVIQKAYSTARLPCDHTDYVECHGTGTPVGDPIEVEALSRVLRRQDGRPTLIGSVKTSMGHSEAASGLTSVIKVTLALQNGLIPANVGFHKRNPNIKTEWNVEIVSEAVPWPQSGVRRASINSFGYGGANAHAILESAQAFNFSDICLESENPISGRFLLPLSASSSESLYHRAHNVSNLGLSGNQLSDLSYTLAHRRTKLAVRGFVVADTRENNAPVFSPLETCGIKTSGKAGHLMFVFTGQGAQWSGMGSHLMQLYPCFRESIRDMQHCLNQLHPQPDINLHDLLSGACDISKVNDALYAQTLCTVLQVALVDMLQLCELFPSFVIGHSSGEIAAAYAAGHLTRHEAIYIAFYRGLAVSEGKRHGAMLVVGQGANDARANIMSLGYRDTVQVACINSPVSVTLSGDETSISELAECYNSRGIFARILKTDGRAYHSRHMKEISATYEVFVATCLTHDKPFTRSSSRMISTVTGTEVGPYDTRKASYWRQNLESTVLFHDAINVCFEENATTMIEIGPHSALEMPIKQIWKERQATNDVICYVSLLKRGMDCVHTFLRAIGELFLYGQNVDCHKVNELLLDHEPQSLRATSTLQLIDLPPYKWQYGPLRDCESRLSREARQRVYCRHPLLGSAIPGGDLKTHGWRGMLHVKDVPWISDHCLGRAIVFPAAAYISMIIEAALQVISQPESGADVHLRDLKFLRALELPQGNSGIEIYTTLRPMSVSASNRSDLWWDCEIASIKNQTRTEHFVGSVGLRAATKQVVDDFTFFQGPFESLSTRAIYQRFHEVGFNVNTDFCSLNDVEVAGVRSKTEAKAKTCLFKDMSRDPTNRYLVHPVTIDAILQTGAIAETKGALKVLTSKVPVSVKSAIFSIGTAQRAAAWSIAARSETVGVGAMIVDGVLYDQDGQVACTITGVRSQTYQAQIQDNRQPQRYPILRTVWKPYASFLSGSQSASLADYLLKYAQSIGSQYSQFQNAHSLCAALDIAVHSTVSAKVLLIGSPSAETAQAIRSVLNIGETFERCAKFDCMTTDVDLSTLTSSFDDQYDIILFSEMFSNTDEAQQVSSVVESLLSPQGTVIFLTHPSPDSVAEVANFTTVTAIINDAQVWMCSALPLFSANSAITNVVIVCDSHGSANDNYIAKAVCDWFGRTANLVCIDDLTEKSVPLNSLVISTVELSDTTLSNLTEARFDALKHITNNASCILWLTGGSLYSGSNPERAIMLGLARAIALEQPALKIISYDLETPMISATSISNIVRVLEHALGSRNPETEFYERNGIVHVSRFMSDEDLNMTFRQQHGKEFEWKTLAEAGPSRLHTIAPGRLDSLHFLPYDLDSIPLGPRDVRIKTQAVGLNAKDLFVLSGRVDTKNVSCSHDIAGVIVTVGSEVKSFLAGDRIVAMAPTYCGTYETVPEWACEKLEAGESFEELCTLPVVFSSAIYALHDRASIQEGESVLIHSAAGGFGQAAIQVAQLSNAEVFVTVGSDVKREFIRNTYNIPESHIFSSRNTDFQSEIMKATQNKGVDVVLNTLTGDLLHSSWQCCAEFGRFVELGKQDIVDHGKLDMSVFARGATFTAFDLAALFHSDKLRYRGRRQELLRETLKYYRQGAIKVPHPLRVFDVANVSDAFKHLASRNQMGKVVLSMSDPKSLIQVSSAPYNTTFSSEKSYLLIGCLGGLGRSLSRWMQERGARKFVFLGRSGTDRPTAAALVQDLQNAGCEVIVVRGDVQSFDDVKKAVQSCPSPLGGVVQAAMGLAESLFMSMSHKEWMTALGPKVRGTWNLHNACQELANPQPDFFLLMSSISGSVGTATEGGYCAANSFLDSFARYRRSLNLPATSLALGMISEVGYLAEHPEIEALLLRRGLQPIKEDEMLQLIDIAISNPQKTSVLAQDEGHFEAHFLTGMETLGFLNHRAQGFEGKSHVMDDPRASLIVRGLMSGSKTNEALAIQHNDDPLPQEVRAALTEGNISSVQAAVLKFVSLKIANLILLEPEKLDPTTPLGTFGMDSMLAAEFRTFVFHLFEVDVPFLLLLKEETTVRSLTEVVAEGLVLRWETEREKLKMKGKEDGRGLVGGSAVR